MIGSYKNVVSELQDTHLAIELINLGARLQLIQNETNLSRRRLLVLHNQVTGKSPAKGMLPYSTDWFIGWSQNIHSSLFANIYLMLSKNSSNSRAWCLVKSYRLYLEQMGPADNGNPVLSITRAWYLLRFFDAGMLRMTQCTKCGGRFVDHANELHDSYVCGFCAPPSRAGKHNVSHH